MNSELQIPTVPESSPSNGSECWRVFSICVLLAVIVWMVFGQTLRDQFVNYDDDVYVFKNDTVKSGLSLKGVEWALFQAKSPNWHPLTWFSHMLDCQFFAMNPAGHHFTSVLLHTAAAVLLFLILRQMTGFLWRSAFVAAVFAIHPLRVESVAWIAERKDVLSGLLFMLTIAAYVWYTRKTSCGRYLLVALMLMLALMSKPMVVTLPFVLFLLDYWPLKRFSSRAGPSPSRLVLEKIPLLMLSCAVCVITIFAQRTAMSSLPLSARAANAIVSYVVYLGQMFCPADLAVFYPYSEKTSVMWKIAAALVLLLGISTGAVVCRKRHPWFLFGWLWYLGMLVPVIGILQVGSQSHADRYTYLPQIGLYIVLTWAIAEALAKRTYRRIALGGMAVSVMVALIFCAHTQVSYWKNSETLWTHTLACTSDNIVAENNLGNALFENGEVDDAIIHYKKALDIMPDHAEAHYNLGNALVQKKDFENAIFHFQQAVTLKPNDAKAHYNLGMALIQTGKLNDAIAHFQTALQLKPDDLVIRNNLGNALFSAGRAGEAVAEFQKVLKLDPDSTEAHYNLGFAYLQRGAMDDAISQFQNVLLRKPDSAPTHYNLGNAFAQKGDVKEAISHYQQALQIKPDYTDAENNLAWLLATAPETSLRDGSKAITLAQQANQLTGGVDPDILGTLAAACAEAGRYGDAVRTAQRAIELAGIAGQRDESAQLKSELAFYQADKPFRQDIK